MEDKSSGKTAKTKLEKDPCYISRM